jgi:cell wall-associated NlpC family hydrolase
MKRPASAVVIACLAIVVGCAPYPRYRTGGSARPAEVPHRQTGYTTNDYIRLGMILRKYLGRPYQGASQYIPGVDCSLFIREVFKEFNKTKLPRTVAKQYETGQKVARRRLQYGDLVFFRTEYDRVSHVGIYVGYNQFIHASTSHGVIISSLDEKYWNERYAGARRVLEMAD